MGKKTSVTSVRTTFKKYPIMNTFCFTFPPFVDAQIKNCIAQGKVTRKLK